MAIRPINSDDGVPTIEAAVSDYKIKLPKAVLNADQALDQAQAAYEEVESYRPTFSEGPAGYFERVEFDAHRDDALRAAYRSVDSAILARQAVYRAAAPQFLVDFKPIFDALADEFTALARDLEPYRTRREEPMRPYMLYDTEAIIAAGKAEDYRRLNDLAAKVYRLIVVRTVLGEHVGDAPEIAIHEPHMTLSELQVFALSSGVETVQFGRLANRRGVADLAARALIPGAQLRWMLPDDLAAEDVELGYKAKADAYAASVANRVPRRLR